MQPGALYEMRGCNESAVVAQVDHRVGERLERMVDVTDAFKTWQQTAKLVSQAKTRSMVPKRCLWPRFGVLRPCGFSGQTDGESLQVRANGADHENLTDSGF